MTKKMIIIVLPVVAFIGVLLFVVLKENQKGYYDAISIQFEEDTSVEEERSILEQFDDAILFDADDSILHDYTLVFPNTSEHDVKKIVHVLTNIECVRDAYYVRAVDLAPNQ